MSAPTDVTPQGNQQQHDHQQAQHDHDHDHGHHHHHHHHHQHSLHETQDTAGSSHNDRNIAHWNKVAKTYNSQHTQARFGDLINKATTFVLSNLSAIDVPFLPVSSTFETPSTRDDDNTNDTAATSIRVLDYACGPGTVTNILAGRATEFIGLDISPNMVAEYNERFSDPSSPPITNGQSQPQPEPLNATAYTANLFDPSGPPALLSSPKFQNFNLVTVGFGFHHFEELPMVTTRLVERLAPGGVLMILDFFSHDKDEVINEAAVNTIAHHGFTEGEVVGLFGKAGLEGVRVLRFPEEVVMMGHARRWPFMAVGKKMGG